MLLVNAAAGGGVPQCGRRRSLLGQLHEIRGGTVGGGKPAGGVRAELLLLLLLNLLLGGRWRRVRADKGTTRKERGRELQLHLLLNLLLDVLLLGLRLLLHLGLLLEISLEQEGDQVLGGHGGGRDNAVGIAAVVVVGDGSTGRGDRGGRHLELLWRKCCCAIICADCCCCCCCCWRLVFVFTVLVFSAAEVMALQPLSCWMIAFSCWRLF